MIKLKNLIIINLKFIIYFILSRAILLSIYIYNLKKIELLYTDRPGFGDYLFFCVEIRNKLNKKKKIFCYSQLQQDTAEFFFDKDLIVSSLILLPRFMNESHMTYNFLSKSKIFKKTDIFRLAPDKSGLKVPISEWHNGTKDSIEFIKSKIIKTKVSKSLIEVFEKKTLCLFIKNFSLLKNNHINFQVRQTRNLDKIYKLLEYLSYRDLNVIILGNDKDHFIKQLSVHFINKFKNIFLFKNISNNYSINDQAYVAYNSIGYLGSMTGAMAFFGVLNKNSIIIDAVSFYSDKFFDNFTFIYKKIYEKEKKKLEIFKWRTFYDPIKFEVVENTFEEIQKNLEDKILNK